MPLEEVDDSGFAVAALQTPSCMLRLA